MSDGYILNLALAHRVDVRGAAVDPNCYGEQGRSVHRAQDIGWPKWWTLLFVVPGINLLYLLVILFWPGRKVEEERASTYTEPPTPS